MAVALSCRLGRGPALLTGLARKFFEVRQYRRQDVGIDLKNAFQIEHLLLNCGVANGKLHQHSVASRVEQEIGIVDSFELGSGVSAFDEAFELLYEIPQMEHWDTVATSREVPVANVGSSPQHAYGIAVGSWLQLNVASIKVLVLDPHSRPNLYLTGL
jgi:hypothetical protein